MRRWLTFILLIAVLFLEAKEGKPTVCLNMIVKNESPVITRCLESVLSVIDYWVIVDTGSTDGTQGIIRDYMKNIPGQLYERPWKNFEHNRNEALELAKDKADYILFMDADDTLVFDKGFVLPHLTADAYLVASLTQGNTTKYYLPRFIKACLEWQWHGVLHEYVSAPACGEQEILEGVYYSYNSGGARSRDPETYRRDAKILKEALREDPENERYMFYLAQSYLCCGELKKAFEAYSLRSEMGGWPEEVFWSLLQMGRIQDRMGLDFKTVKETLLEAYEYRPSRIEPLYYIAQRAIYVENDFKLAYEMTKKGIDTKVPSDTLFVELWIYEYGMLFEFSIAAYRVAKYQESLDACDKLLAMESLPEPIRKQTELNRGFALKKLKLVNFLKED